MECYCEIVTLPRSGNPIRNEVSGQIAASVIQKATNKWFVLLMEYWETMKVCFGMEITDCKFHQGPYNPHLAMDVIAHAVKSRLGLKDDNYNELTGLEFYCERNGDFNDEEEERDESGVIAAEELEYKMAMILLGAMESLYSFLEWATHLK